MAIVERGDVVEIAPDVTPRPVERLDVEAAERWHPARQQCALDRFGPLEIALDLVGLVLEDAAERFELFHLALQRTVALFELREKGSPLSFDSRVLQRVAHRDAQAHGLAGLGEEVEGPELNCLDRGIEGLEPGEHDPHRVGPRGLCPAHEREPVELRHQQIGDDQVDLAGFEKPLRREPVRSLEDLSAAELAEPMPYEKARRALVVDHEDGLQGDSTPRS